MISVDVLVVGGGPAGSSCAWRLRRHGVECLVLDRAAFPRPKLCAGWVTPQVVEDLAIEPGEYPGGFLTFDALRLGLKGLAFTFRTVQHSIRRVEFDAWLLERSGAPIEVHDVREIREEGGGYVVDGRYRCRQLVGAAGTSCPVRRALFRGMVPRPEALQAVVLEEEFPHGWADGTCRLWFFERGLPGYSWYVPKAGGHLNVGIGGMAKKLKARGDAIRPHWQRLTGKLVEDGLVHERAWDPGGYTYYLRPRADAFRRGSALLVGDAAGLATRDLCEGIGPAVRSGLLAADAIALGRPYDLATVARHSVEHGLVRRALDRAFCGRA
jgi:flavin-dependent dehydrogenase